MAHILSIQELDEKIKELQALRDQMDEKAKVCLTCLSIYRNAEERRHVRCYCDYDA